MIFEVLTRNIFTIKEKKMFLACLSEVSANVDPTFKNSATESPTFGAIAMVNPTGVQWKGLDLGEFDVNFNKYKFFWYGFKN